MKTCATLAVMAAVAAATVFAPDPAACAESMQSGSYSAIVDDAGKVSIRRDRVAIVTTSYGGIFGPLPSGAAIYWVDAGHRLQVERVGEGTDRPRLVLGNTGERGVTMRREVVFEEGGVRLVHEITVPAGVAGSIDTGFTLNAALGFDATVSVRANPEADPSETKLGAGDDCLPYRSDFQRIVFDGEWGTLAVEFDTSEGMQPRGSLLNGARSTRRPGEWVQVLPLSAGIAQDQPAKVYRSSCLVSFEPAPGKTYLSPRRNLLYNSGFEDWSSPDLPDGWRRMPYATEQTSAGMTADETAPFEGQRSLRWSLEGGVLSHATQHRDYYAPGSVEAPCVFSVHLRGEPAGVRVALRCGGGRQEVETTADWQRFAVVAPTGSGGRNFPISVEKLSPGVLWLDAAQLEEADAPTAYVPRERATVFGIAPFPSDLMAQEIAEVLENRPPLGGCGPELSYYTSERTGRLVYALRLSPARRATASLKVTLTDPAGAPVLEQTFPAPGPRVTVEFDAARLPLGTSHALATLTDAEGAIGSLSHGVLKLRPLTRGVEVKINRLTRTLVRDGQPYIPVGSDGGTTVERVLECIDSQAANGLNHIHIWDGFFEYLKTANGRVPQLRPDDLLGLLDHAHEAGLTVTVNLSHWLSINHFNQARFRNPDVTDDQLLEGALQAVRVAREHPAVLTWHLLDEPSPAWCSPEWTERIYRAVSQEDPYHPAEINVGGSSTNMSAYISGSDLMSVDIYPVPTAHLGIIAPHTRFMRLADDWRPIRWWIQSYGYVREPTALEESCMTWQAVVEGTRFVLFYNYRPTSWSTWSALGRVAAELEELRPALAAEREDIPVARPDDDRIVASLHRTGEGVFVIAVNRDTEPIEAEFTLPLDCTGKTAEVMFEARQVTAAGRSFVDGFEPMARHVYRFDL